MQGAAVLVSFMPVVSVRVMNGQRSSVGRALLSPAVPGNKSNGWNRTFRLQGAFCAGRSDPGNYKINRDKAPRAPDSNSCFSKSARRSAIATIVRVGLA